MLATLNQCGNPSSGFFDPLLNDIPTILNTLSGGSGAATAQSLLQQGLTQIANAEQGSKATPTTPSTSTPAQKSPATSSTTTTTTVPPSTTTTTTPCGLLGAVLGCSGGPARVRARARSGLGLVGLGTRRFVVEPGDAMRRISRLRQWPSRLASG